MEITYNLPDSLNIRTGAKLQQELLTLIANEDVKSVNLIADKIQYIDTSSIQILLAFIKEAKQKNIAVQINDPSTSFLEYAILIGAQAELLLEE